MSTSFPPSLPLHLSAYLFIHDVNSIFSPLFLLFKHSGYLGGYKVYRREPTTKQRRPGDRRTTAPEIKFVEGNRKKEEKIKIELMTNHLVAGEGPLHPKTIIFNLLWLTFGFGLPLVLYFFVIGLLQVVIIVGMSSGFETIRLAWYDNIHYSYFMFHISCFIFHIPYFILIFIFHISYFMFHVSCFMSHILCFLIFDI